MQLHGFSLFMGVLIGFLAGRQPTVNLSGSSSAGIFGGLRADTTMAKPLTTYILSRETPTRPDASANIIPAYNALFPRPRVMFILTRTDAEPASPPTIATSAEWNISLSFLTALKRVSEFDAAADALFARTMDYDMPLRNNSVPKEWNNRALEGLAAQDRELLAQVYGEADSVFEYGLGESTYIASLLGVPRYSGIDSDLDFLATARNQSLPHFRFYYGDVTDAKDETLQGMDALKNAFNYQAAALLAEPLPFDVYMVNGKWRVAIVALSFLHASARGADHADTKILLPGCIGDASSSYLRSQFVKLNDMLQQVNQSNDKFCVFKRKATTANKDLLELWEANTLSA